MKLKRIGMIGLLAGVLTLSLTACEDGTEQKTAAEEEESPVAEEDKTAGTTLENAVEVPEEQETIAPAEEAEEVEEGCPADAGQAILYYANEAGDNYEMKAVELEEVTPQKLIEQLEAEGTLPEGQIQVNSFTEEEEEGMWLLRLDLSSGFLDYLRSMGSTGETVTMGCVVNTFLETYDADLIEITVDGAAFETGNQEYKGYIKHFGDMAAVSTE